MCPTPSHLLQIITATIQELHLQSSVNFCHFKSMNFQSSAHVCSWNHVLCTIAAKKYSFALIAELCKTSRNFYTNYSNKINYALTQLFCLCSKKYLLPQKSNLEALLTLWVILQHQFVVNIRNSTWPRLLGFATERNCNNTQWQQETNTL